VNIYLLSISIVSNRYLVSPFVAHENYTSWMKGFFYYCMTIPVVKKHSIHNVYCSSATDGDTKYLKKWDDMKIPVERETYHTRFLLLLVLSCLSHSFRYLVSPSVGHEHYISCVICFCFYWYFHVVSLHIIHNVSCSCATDGDTKYLTERDDMTIPVVKKHIIHNVYCSSATAICCTRTWHIVYDRFRLLLVLLCLLTPLCIWYPHLLHTNMTHCVW
jgi:hypothetical protein